MCKFFITVYLILLTTLCSCTPMTEKEKHFAEPIHWHRKKYEGKPGLCFSGSGGSIPDKIRWFTLFYEADMQVGIDEARRLIVPMADDFIQHVNQNTEIAPYMQNFPISAKNLLLIISFLGKDMKEPRSPNLSSVSIPNDHVYYKTWNGIRSVVVHKEKYEDALRIIREEQGLCE